MSQIGRTVKNLEAPRPLKSTSRQTHHSQLYEVQSIEELITLTENVAASLASGHSNTESMTILSANLRSHGPQLEMISKDTLDRAFVTFRNASQDERLSIITRMNLLELIELRAKLWQNSDGINTYYKHKATDVQPDNLAINDLSMLSTSPPATNALGQQQQQQQPLILGPGELIRPSGKFTKPTKIPGKNYSKDEVVIRNADSGKVNPGAKERLVQITGPNEDKINYAKSLIEDTIRRNASPVRLEAPQDGSCSSLASSISDDATSRANRNSVGAMIASSGGVGGGGIGITGGAGIGSGGIHPNNYVPNQNAGFHNSNNTNNNNNNNTNAMIGIGGGGGGGGIGIGGLHGLNNLNSKFSRNSTGGGGGQLLLHSLSTNDASLGEYKYTVGIGHHTIKITGDCFELVRVAKLVLDDYFSSNEFLASVEAGATLDNTLSSSSSSSLPMNASSIGGGGGGFVSPGTAPSGHHHPTSHQLISSSPFADSGIGLNLMGSSSGPLINNIGNINQNNNNNNNTNNNNNNNSSIEVDDDVFIVENDSSSNSSSSNSTVTSSATHGKSGTVASSSSSAAPTNGLTRSRRSHFSRKESTPDTKDKELLSNSMRIVHEYERLIFYAKSPHSWVLPRDWNKITEKHPTIIRNKNIDDESKRFDADKYLALVKSGVYTKIDVDLLLATEESPEPPE